MENKKSTIIGISDEAINYIENFMSRVKMDRAIEDDIIPIIGIVHSSKHFTEEGDVISRGEHFVLGAISKSKLEDEIVIISKGLEVAMRIPPKPRFFGKYYFVLHNQELVNDLGKS